MRKMLLWTSLLALAVAVAASAAPETVLLQFKGEDGDRIRYFTRVDAKGTATVLDPKAPGKTVEFPITVSGHATSIVRIDAVTAKGDLVMGGSIESFAFTAKAAEASFSLAIEGPGGTPPQWLTLPTPPIVMVVRKDGKLIGIRGLDQLPLLPLAKPPAGDDEQVSPADALERLLLESSVPLFPDHPVKVGDVWTQTIDLDVAKIMDVTPLPAPVKAAMKTISLPPIKAEYRLEGFETVDRVECAKIHGTREWSLRIPEGEGEDLPVGVTESVRVGVLIMFDHQAGRCQSITQNISIEMKASGLGSPTALTLNIHTRTTRE